MQIIGNKTGMETDLTVATNKEGQNFCVVVVKGSFDIQKNGQATLAEKQRPLEYADVHYGDPENTSIQYVSDFAPFKPRADVLVNGFAYSPTGKPVNQLPVQLEIGKMKKQLMVFGDRKWDASLIGAKTTPTIPFFKIPIVYERAFGGSDKTDPNEKNHGIELRNPVGVGYHTNGSIAFIDGTPLPNIENPKFPINSWSDKPPPAGLSCLGHHWHPKTEYVGTYDQHWLDNVSPLLPFDFNERFYQSAPMDQQFPYFKGGESIRCINMSPEQLLEFAIPTVDIPINFRFPNHKIDIRPNLDTVLIEPDLKQVLLTWRVRVAIGRKSNTLKEIIIGHHNAESKSDSGDTVLMDPRFLNLRK